MNEPGIRTTYPRDIQRGPRVWINIDRVIAIGALAIGFFISSAPGPWPSLSGLLTLSFPAFFFWWSNWRPLIAFMVLSPFVWFMVAFGCDKSAAQKDFGQMLVHLWHAAYWIWIVLAIIRATMLWRGERQQATGSVDEL